LNAKDLQKRLNRLAAGKTGVPSWLEAVASHEEIAEYKAIMASYPGGWDHVDRMSAFTREMRRRHPNMPMGVAERLEVEGAELTDDELRQEGVDEETVQAWRRRREASG
jgi:hypothetical protein